MGSLFFTMLILLAAATVHAQDSPPQPTPEPQPIMVDGLERTYALHVPDNLTDPAPVVLLLHGRTGTGAGIARYTGFDELSDREGFIALYPDALDGEWNFVKDIPGYAKTQDDTAFLTALVDHIAAAYPVDLSRVYIAGFSNGGFMAQRIACENPTRFAAFASVAAAGFGGMPLVCMESGSSPMLLMHGTADNNIPWNGLIVQRGQQTLMMTYPVPQTLAFWANFNGCQPEADTTRLPRLGLSPGSSVRVLSVDCPEDAPVILYAIIDGGHNWPGRAEGIPAAIAGEINLDIDASREIWKFFAQHRREQAPAESSE